MILMAVLLQGVSAAPAGNVAALPAAEKKICRSDVALGSVIPKRTCHTRAEWSRIDKASAGINDGSADRLRNSGNGRAGSDLN